MRKCQCRNWISYDIFSINVFHIVVMNVNCAGIKCINKINNKLLTNKDISKCKYRYISGINIGEFCNN